MKFGHSVRRKDQKDLFSRRTFLQGLQWSPLLFLPAPLHGLRVPYAFGRAISKGNGAIPFTDFRHTPHYPGKSPLDHALSRVGAGNDEFVSEKYAYEIQSLLNDWGLLKEAPLAQSALTRLLDNRIAGLRWFPIGGKRFVQDTAWNAAADRCSSTSSNGKFSLNRGGFQCGQPPQGTFTHAAVADYDRDGRKSP